MLIYAKRYIKTIILLNPMLQVLLCITNQLEEINVAYRFQQAFAIVRRSGGRRSKYCIKAEGGHIEGTSAATTSTAIRD